MIKQRCCDSATTCPGCGRAVCPEHETGDPAFCEREGELVCKDCHELCDSVPCAKRNDPGCPHDAYVDELLSQ